MNCMFTCKLLKGFQHVELIKIGAKHGIIDEAAPTSHSKLGLGCCPPPPGQAGVAGGGAVVAGAGGAGHCCNSQIGLQL